MQKIAVYGLLLILAGCTSTRDSTSFVSTLSYDASNLNPPPVKTNTAVNMQMSDNQEVDKSGQLENETYIHRLSKTYVSF